MKTGIKVTERIYKNARIITMSGQEVIENGVLVVRAIEFVKVCDAALCNNEEFEEGNPRMIDCTGKTACGLISSHSPLLWRSFGDITMEKDIATEALMACRNALNCIRKASPLSGYGSTTMSIMR